MATLKHLSPVTLKEQLYREILTQIQTGTYKPGDKIPTELQLSEMYDISRVTVRQTLARLVEEQILIKRAGKGTFVKDTPFIENFYQSLVFLRPLAVRSAHRKILFIGIVINALHLSVNPTKAKGFFQCFVCFNRFRIAVLTKQKPNAIGRKTIFR